MNGTTHHIEFVTQAQYNQLEQEQQLVAGTYYFITDDETAEEFAEAIEILQTDLAIVNEYGLETRQLLTGTRADVANMLPTVGTLVRNPIEDENWMNMASIDQSGNVTVNNTFSAGLYAVKVVQPTPAAYRATFTMWVPRNGEVCLSPVFVWYDGVTMYQAMLRVNANGEADIVTVSGSTNYPNTTIYANRIGTDET